MFMITGCVNDGQIDRKNDEQVDSKDITTCGAAETLIISDPAGARIEINNDYIGMTPIKTKIQRVCTSDRYFSGDSIDINAIPSKPGQCVQRKRITTLQRTPKNIYFNMNLCPRY